MLATCPPGRIKRRRQLERGRYADRFDGDVGTESTGQRPDDLQRILAGVVDGDVGAERLRRVEPAVGQVDRDDRRRAVQPRADDRGEPDRAGADDGDDVARADLTVEHADLVAGRQDVGQHQHRFVADAGRDRVGRQIGERDPHELGLRAVDLVAEDPAAAAEALAGVALPAVLARAARRDARHEHAVADLHTARAVADRHDRADRLVAEDATVGHRRHVALHDVQIGAADRRRLDPHDRVGAVDDHRIGDLFPCLACRDRDTREPS